LVHDTDADSLLVEVDADKVHGSLLVWKQKRLGNNANRRFTRHSRKPERGFDLLSIVSNAGPKSQKPAFFSGDLTPSAILFGTIIAPSDAH
jgi:hypothetical protein